jgi:hypothetical protein
MSPPTEPDLETGRVTSNESHNWKFALSALSALLGIGILLRSVGVPLPAWVLVATGAALAFVFVLPALGGRLNEPDDSPLKKAPWGF